MIYKTIKSARIDTSSIDPSLNKDLSDYAKTAYDSLEEIAELVPELNDVIGGFENDVLVPLKDLKITSSRKPLKSAVDEAGYEYDYELVDDLCQKAIDEMGGDKDALFFSSTTFKDYDGFILKGHYLDNIADEYGDDPEVLWTTLCTELGMQNLYAQGVGQEWEYGQLYVKWAGSPVTSSRKPIKSSADNLPSEVYYMMVNGAKMYYSTDYDKVADMVRKTNSKPGPRVYGPYTEDDPEEIQELYEVGYLSNSRKAIKSSDKNGVTWEIYRPGIDEPYLTDDFDEAMSFKQDGFKVKVRREKKKVNSGLDYAQKGDVVIAKKGTKVVGFIGQNADKTFYYGFGNPGNASGVMVVNDFDSAARQLEKRL